VRVLFVIALLLALGARGYAADIAAVSLQRSGEGAIFIDGDIAVGDYETFLTKVGPYTSGVVILNSRGGSAMAGIRIGQAIRMRNFATWVPNASLCASACAMAWLGGTRRLMGSQAKIGFHSVYRIDKGVAVETGAGNAAFGAYLAQLGLSERTIMYLSSAAPDSMNWLTPKEAESLGISLTVFDPDASKNQTTPSVRAPSDHQIDKRQTTEAPASLPESLEKRSRDFVIAVNTLLSGSTEKFIGILAGLYGEQVTYYGKAMPRSDVVAQVGAFLKRWPTRQYSARPESIKVVCNGETRCLVEGQIDFDARSVDRNQRSYGVANFVYLLEFAPGSRWPVIVSESGSLVDRRLEALYQPKVGIGRDFGAQQ